MLMLGGAVLAVLGGVVSTVSFLQPWRKCTDDDVPAACPMLPDDAAVMYLALGATLVGIVALVVAAGMRSSR
jgi:hypothetical protein